MWPIILFSLLSYAYPQNSIPSAPQMTARLRQAKLWPGDKFPAACPSGFQNAKDADLSLNSLLPEDRPFVECEPLSKTDLFKRIMVRRSGTLVASVNIELSGVAQKSCDTKALTSAFGSQTTKSESMQLGQNGQSTSVWSIDGQQVWTALTCTKIQKLADTMTLKIMTNYSGLQSNGLPPLGPIRKSQRIEFGEEEPYFPPRGANVKAIGASLEQDIKKAEPLTRILSPLGKKLYQDNIDWRKNAARIQRQALKSTTSQLPPPSATSALKNTARETQGPARLRGQAEDQNIRPESPCVAECMKSQLMQEKPDKKCAGALQNLSRGKAEDKNAQECMQIAMERAGEVHKSCAEQCK